MLFISRRSLNLVLALALPLLPLWHHWEHADDAGHVEPVCEDRGQDESHWHKPAALPGHCDDCHALSQKTQAPVAAELPAPAMAWIALDASRSPAARVLEFPYFDRRGPPPAIL